MFVRRDCTNSQTCGHLRVLTQSLGGIMFVHMQGTPLRNLTPDSLNHSCFFHLVTTSIRESYRQYG